MLAMALSQWWSVKCICVFFAVVQCALSGSGPDCGCGALNREANENKPAGCEVPADKYSATTNNKPPDLQQNDELSKVTSGSSDQICGSYCSQSVSMPDAKETWSRCLPKCDG